MTYRLTIEMNLFLGIDIFVGSDVAKVLYNLLMTLSNSFCIFFYFLHLFFINLFMFKTDLLR